MQKLLIADSSESFTSALSQQLQHCFHVVSCNDGREALSMLLLNEIDILILDLTISGIDGISILKAAFSSGIRPTVVATVSITGYYINSSLEQLGVVYVMRKPCHVNATARRIIEISQYPKGAVNCEPDNRERAEGMLQVLGFKPQLHQYPFLLEALLLYKEDPKQSITKVLYPKVAKKLGGNWTRVEKSIRDLIKFVWTTRDEQIWKAFFPENAYNDNLRAPSNKQFLHHLSDMLD